MFVRTYVQAHHGAFQMGAIDLKTHVVVDGRVAALIFVEGRTVEQIRCGAAAATHYVGDARLLKPFVIVDVPGNFNDARADLRLQRFETTSQLFFLLAGSVAATKKAVMR